MTSYKNPPATITIPSLEWQQGGKYWNTDLDGCSLEVEKTPAGYKWKSQYKGNAIVSGTTGTLGHAMNSCIATVPQYP